MNATQIYQDHIKDVDRHKVNAEEQVAKIKKQDGEEYLWKEWRALPQTQVFIKKLEEIGIKKSFEATILACNGKPNNDQIRALLVETYVMDTLISETIMKGTYAGE